LGSTPATVLLLLLLRPQPTPSSLGFFGYPRRTCRGGKHRPHGSPLSLTSRHHGDAYGKAAREATRGRGHQDLPLGGCPPLDEHLRRPAPLQAQLAGTRQAGAAYLEPNRPAG